MTNFIESLKQQEESYRNPGSEKSNERNKNLIENINSRIDQAE